MVFSINPAKNMFLQLLDHRKLRLFLFVLQIIQSSAGCLFLPREVYYNRNTNKYIFSLGFKDWATQALPVVDERIGGKAGGKTPFRFHPVTFFFNMFKVTNNNPSIFLVELKVDVLFAPSVLLHHRTRASRNPFLDIQF